MSNKQKTKRITIDDNVFRAKVVVYVNCSQDHFNGIIKTKHDAPDFPDVDGAEGNFLSWETDGGTMYCLWLESFDGTVNKLSVLNHEMIHCAYSILKDRGIEISDETEEVLAYYHSFLLTEAYRKLTKRKELVSGNTIVTTDEKAS